MKISQREKLLSGALLVTAFIVWMLSGEGVGGAPDDVEIPSVTSGRIFEQYRRIQPLPTLKTGKETDNTMSKRNIFQFGSRTVNVEQNDTSAGLSAQESDTQITDGSNSTVGEGGLSSETATPQPPDVDFQVIGVILAGPVRGVVITRAPEVFVIEESQQFLDHFILKSVKREGIVIGYTDFKDELFIPLKKDGGLQ
ncbi:MAG: hypothetical protein CO090_04540 [Acidobacteria bacterium CG_4_9_14_3_um_filter_49_7]|nr:MAG: hypothetical protein CO090_04540 [Acidobacteria bacterium CG_4_9_14_3_um_filter_49_7]